MLIAIAVIDEIAVTRRAEPPTLHLAAQPKGKWLSVYRLKSNEQSPPGLDINCNTNISSGRRSSSNNVLATIELRFPDIQSMPRFWDL